MKNALKICILVGISSILRAQVPQDTLPWCPPGAKWLYDGIYYSGFLAPVYQNFYLLEYVQDTIIQNKVCKVIQVYNANFNDQRILPMEYIFPNKIYLHLQNDTVYYWDNYSTTVRTADSTFKIAYFFEGQIGDSVEINSIPIVPCYDDYYVVYNQFHNCYIDSIYYQVLNGSSYKTFKMTYGPYWSVGKEIIRNIGPTSCILPGPYYDQTYTFFLGIDTIGNCPYMPYTWIFPRKLLCYYDPLRGTIELPDTGTIQDFHIQNNYQCGPTMQRPSAPIENNFILYPNPVKDRFYIKENFSENQEIVSIDLYDAQGRCIEKSHIQVIDLLHVKEFQISTLSSGVYFVTVTKKNGSTQTIRFIKE